MEVLQPGVLTTAQDLGRTGHRARGINPNGAMDWFALRALNALLANDVGEAALEMHFPAPRLRFPQLAVACLAGADFAATLDGLAIPPWRPFAIAAGSELSFTEAKWGHRAYLGVMGGWDVAPWLGSRSTNLMAGIGGFQGRALRKGDRLDLRTPLHPFPAKSLPWKISPELVDQTYAARRLRVVAGPEWDWLSAAAKHTLANKPFAIAAESNRTGYRLHGALLTRVESEELLSGGVTAGTMQLPASGQPIILMADHPVTGGYPRIVQVISADLLLLAQLGPGAELRFELIEQPEAELLYLTLDRHLRQLADACRARVNQWLSTAST